jgi:hypothetical protein
MLKSERWYLHGWLVLCVGAGYACIRQSSSGERTDAQAFDTSEEDKIYVQRAAALATVEILEENFMMAK